MVFSCFHHMLFVRGHALAPLWLICIYEAICIYIGAAARVQVDCVSVSALRLHYLFGLFFYMVCVLVSLGNFFSLELQCGLGIAVSYRMETCDFHLCFIASRGMVFTMLHCFLMSS